MTSTVTDTRTGAPGARLSPPAHALIERSMPRARGLALQYSGPRLDDDDLVSAAYLGLVEAANRFDVAVHQDGFWPYAEKIVRTHIREALARAPMVRRGVKREKAALRSGEARGWTPHGVAVEHLGMAAGAAPDEDLAEALALLPDDERAVIELHVMEGFGVGQVAMRLGMARPEVRAAKARGLARLAASMAERN